MGLNGNVFVYEAKYLRLSRYQRRGALRQEAEAPQPDGEESDNNSRGQNASDKDRAAALGYTRRIPPQKAPFNSHGQTVYSDGKNFITMDVVGYNV